MDEDDANVELFKVSIKKVSIYFTNILKRKLLKN